MRFLPLKKQVYINVINRKCVIRFVSEPDGVEYTPIVKRCYPFLGGHQKITFLYEVQITKKEALSYLKKYQKEFGINIPEHIFTRMGNPRRQVKKDYSHVNFDQPVYHGGDITEAIMDIMNNKKEVAITTVKAGIIEMRMSVLFAQKHKLDYIKNLSPYGLYTKNLEGSNTRFAYYLHLSPVACYFLADILKTEYLNLAMRLLAFSDMQLKNYKLDPTSKKSLWDSEYQRISVKEVINA